MRSTRTPGCRRPRRSNASSTSAKRADAQALCLLPRLRRHRPIQLVVAGRIGARGLRGIAVDQRPQVVRMLHAAHLVLDLEQVLAGVEIDDVAEAILVLV